MEARRQTQHHEEQLSENIRHLEYNAENNELLRQNELLEQRMAEDRENQRREIFAEKAQNQLLEARLQEKDEQLRMAGQIIDNVFTTSETHQSSAAAARQELNQEQQARPDIPMEIAEQQTRGITRKRKEETQVFDIATPPVKPKMELLPSLTQGVPPARKRSSSSQHQPTQSLKSRDRSRPPLTDELPSKSLMSAAAAASSSAAAAASSSAAAEPPDVPMTTGNKIAPSKASIQNLYESLRIAINRKQVSDEVKNRWNNMYDKYKTGNSKIRSIMLKDMKNLYKDHLYEDKRKKKGKGGGRR